MMKADLHQAVLDNDIKRVFMLLYHHQANINELDVRGEPPIFHAIRHGNALMVQLLVHLGANLTHVGVDRWNVLHHAAHAKQYDILRCIVDNLLYRQQLCDIPAANTLGHTPLHFAQCPFIISHFALLLTFYGKNLYLQEENFLNTCSSDIQQAIEQHMLVILIDREYRMRLLAIILEQQQVLPISAEIESIIRTIFLVSSDNAPHDINRLITIAQHSDFDQVVDCIDHDLKFKNYPIFELYSHDKLNIALVVILKQLKQYVDDVLQQTFLQQVRDDVQDKVNAIMAYYRKPSASIQNRPFSLT